LSEARDELVRMLRGQAHYCGVIGSPLYEGLLEHAAEDVVDGGPAWDVLEGHDQAVMESMLPLRMMGGVHRLVLAGEAPALARFYPSVGGSADAEAAWPALRELLGDARDRIRHEIETPVQTNEVARCAALLGGFLTVARDTGLPLRVLEIGASAGFNLNWDSYRYESGGRSWGPGTSKVRFDGFLEQGDLPFDVDATVIDRRGCDLSPLDPSSERDRLALRSVVWPDMVDRFRQLDAALDLAVARPVTLDRADAIDWAQRQLRQLDPGKATVLFHSLVMLYLGEEGRARLTDAIQEAGERATTKAPLAWLRMELGGDEADVHLTTWPGGEERLVARAHYQGASVTWLGLIADAGA
jgi:hypothetical protein